MSVHMVPTAYAGRMYEQSAVELAGRAPADGDRAGRTDGLVTEGDEDVVSEVTFTYTPDLTSGEAKAFDDTLEGMKWGLTMAQYRARKTDWVLANQMLSVAAPTDVQFRDWLRAVTRIQQAILDSRDVSS
jgi:hypothetical protein